jgi:hypothetical protein
MPIANVNRMTFCELATRQSILLYPQPIAVWRCFAAILWLRVHSRPIGMRLVIGQAVNLYLQFGEFFASQALHNPSTYSKWCFPVVIGLGHTTAQSVILFHLTMSLPNRNLPNLYELWKNTCQTAIGWLIVQIGWRIVQIGWRVVNLQKSILFTFALGMIFASTTKLF